MKADKAARIKADITSKMTQAAIAKKHKVSRSTVSDIATGRIHKEVPWPNGEPVPKKSGGQHKKLEEHDPTNKHILELEAEVIHLTEERNRERVKSKASAKTQGLFRAITAEMDQRIKPFKAIPSQIERHPKAQIVEHCVMHLSDGHHDAVVRPEEVGGLEDYNFPISCARAERYVKTVIEWTQNTLAPKFHFPVLWVLAYGDFTSGEIHKACERSYYRNQFKNCLAIGQLHALMYRDLAAHFEQVNVLYLAGNHGRRTPKKDYLGAHDNWDYLCGEVARLHCRSLENVYFTIPDAWSANININGVGFNVSHGDDVRSNLGIPWYGMVRRQKGLIALGAAAGAKRCRYFCCGHHHAASTLSDVDGELLINGSWLGTDAFAYNSLSGYREPAQWFHGVNPKHGLTWRMNVKLRHEDEKSGPQRYIIDGGRDIGPLK
ncbi:MAG: hypothetical protein ACYC35_00705 [Pirellulales bacterium]